MPINYITYNPPTIISLPPYVRTSIPAVIRLIEDLTHSGRASDFSLLSQQQMQHAHFRLARKIGRQLGPVNPIVLTAQLAALEDMLTAAKTVHSAQIATTHAKLRTLIDVTLFALCRSQIHFISPPGPPPIFMIP
jgi:hypothetical protein